MDKKEFLRLLKAGKISDDQLVLFLLNNYVLNDFGIDDFADDLVFRHGCGGGYAAAMRQSCYDAIKRYIRRHNPMVETWEQQQERLAKKTEVFPHG